MSCCYCLTLYWQRLSNKMATFFAQLLSQFSFHVRWGTKMQDKKKPLVRVENPKAGDRIHFHELKKKTALKQQKSMYPHTEITDNKSRSDNWKLKSCVLRWKSMKLIITIWTQNTTKTTKKNRKQEIKNSSNSQTFFSKFHNGI